MIEVAGRAWAVKEAPEGVGPGPNRFSDRPADVFVDAQGRLHLTVRFHDGHWWATEVFLSESLGHGTYAFQTESPLDELDPGVTFGAFLWDPFGDEETVPGGPFREIDFEDSRWGDADDPTNAQMVVQPFAVSGNVHRYTIPDLGSEPGLTRLLTWLADRVEFVALRGFHPPLVFPPADVSRSTPTPTTPPRAASSRRPAARRSASTCGPTRSSWADRARPGRRAARAVEVVVTQFVPEPGRLAQLPTGLVALSLLACLRRTESRNIRPAVL